MSNPSPINVVSTSVILLTAKQTAARTVVGINSLAEKLTQEIYKNKCTCPSFEDVLNFIYDVQDGKQNDFASALSQAWRSDDATFGLIVRKQMKDCFLEVAEIEAIEEMEECVCQLNLR